MSGKSRHHKGKHSFQGRKKKGRKHLPVVAAQQVVTQAPEPEISEEVSAPLPSVPTSLAKPAVAKPAVAKASAVQYPYVTAELWRIGILAGIIVFILIVLALVLS